MKNSHTRRIVNSIQIVVGLFSFLFLFLSCRGKASSEEEVQTSITPVTVTQPVVDCIQEEMELNAVSSFLRKSIIKVVTNGYIKSVNVMQGQRVVKGQTLFVLKGKEAENLGSFINDLGTNTHFTGEIKITAGSSGYITNIAHQVGDYVQEGDVLAEISDANSLVFLMQLPYELKPYLVQNATLKMKLPDGESFKGVVSYTMPTVDPVSQTLSVVIKANVAKNIPENLIAKAVFVKSTRNKAVLLPKATVLTDETQEHFWIMKMVDKDTAVKVLIKKGIESKGLIEILSPKLSANDLILESGNYGLPDTAKVVIKR